RRVGKPTRRRRRRNLSDKADRHISPPAAPGRPAARPMPTNAICARNATRSSTRLPKYSHYSRQAGWRKVGDFSQRSTRFGYALVVRFRRLVNPDRGVKARCFNLQWSSTNRRPELFQQDDVAVGLTGALHFQPPHSDIAQDPQTVAFLESGAGAGVDLVGDEFFRRLPAYFDIEVDPALDQAKILAAELRALDSAEIAHFAGAERPSRLAGPNGEKDGGDYSLAERHESVPEKDEVRLKTVFYPAKLARGFWASAAESVRSSPARPVRPRGRKVSKRSRWRWSLVSTG